ncbi:type II secretion protein F [Cellulomonas composti]|uniref:Type II secretion system protein GspF domain-containing protein n=1 Tax=Cellulomonas composti TaxID=266130 RepID=A0A511JCR0_9CELL|nr:type II secretion protein F [Cellulomonas composti]GEL95788.1 hypothetical protein CCO02nite_24460 [Cellulomonas composti]
MLRGPPWSQRSAGAAPDASEVLVGVVAQLRAGRTPERAWSEVLGRPVPPGGPDERLLVTVLTGDGRVGAERRRSATGAARTVVAAGAVAARVGAPLAAVLESAAAGVAADQEAADELAAALAGPRATARVLTILPLLGLALGAALGAHPVAVLLDGGPGSACGVLGVALLLVGRRWTTGLVRHVERSARSGVRAGSGSEP